MHKVERTSRQRLYSTSPGIGEKLQFVKMFVTLTTRITECTRVRRNKGLIVVVEVWNIKISVRLTYIVF